MAEMQSQTYGTHRRFYPLFHFVALPLLVLNVVVRAIYVWRHAGAKLSWWELVVALTLVCLALTIRTMATRLQDRVIRMEETLRLQRCLPDDLRGRIGDLSPGQLIGLRFCADAEVPELVRAVFSDNLGREDIKKRIKNWRPDTLRV